MHAHMSFLWCAYVVMLLLAVVYNFVLICPEGQNIAYLCPEHIVKHSSSIKMLRIVTLKILRSVTLFINPHTQLNSNIAVNPLIKYTFQKFR